MSFLPNSTVIASIYPYRKYIKTMKNSSSALLAVMAIFGLSGCSLMANAATQPGVFYVANYVANGTHTDYDMARQAADAYAAATPWAAGSVLILKSGINSTCDAVPLPSLGNQSTTSIIGAGSGLSTIQKSASCPASGATLQHLDSPNGDLSRGLYQGFTVDANHVDAAACNVYGMSETTFLDVSCGNAIAGADHELEFGNRDANSVGWMDNIYIYDLKTFDSVIGGTGAVLTPVWSGSALASVTVTSSGASRYTAQYTRAQLFGPGLVKCSTVPTITPKVGANGLLIGAVVTNPGVCSSTANIYILVQDGTPVTYGMKFTNTADSHVWGLQATGATTYGIGWLNGSADNSIYYEKPGADELYQIIDNANGNRHISPGFKDAAGYVANIDAQNGTIQDAIITWSTTSHPGVSGYYFGNDRRVYQDWMIQDSACGSDGTAGYLSMTTELGVPSTSNPVPAGVKPQNVATCDGTGAMSYATIQ
jgi:hypothetical protein